MRTSTGHTVWRFAVLLLVIMISSVRGETSASIFIAGMDNNAVEDQTSGVGDTVSVICHVIELAEDQVVSMTRETKSGGNESLMWNSNGTSSANTKHIEFDGFVNIAPGMFLYTLIVHNVTKYDAGTYSCEIFRQFGNRFTPVVSDDAHLRILHFPDAMYPICAIISANKSLTRYADDQVTFRCESELGDPEVFLDWTLLRNGPDLPRPNEVVDDGITYSEIVVDLRQGHSGKQFECTLTSGLYLTIRPKCSIGPYNVQPKPPTTGSPKVTIKSDVVTTTLVPTTALTSHTTLQGNNSVDGNAGLSKAAIAGVCVIVVLSLCIVLIIAAAWLIKTSKCWSPETKSPLSEKSRVGLGIGNIGNSIVGMMNPSTEDPELLGFKRRTSKKAHLKSETDSDSSGEHGIENGILAALEFDTIAEDEESRSSTPSSLRKPIPTAIILPFQTNQQSVDDHDSLSPTSPQADQPFLPSPQPNDCYVTPPASPATQGEEPPASPVSNTPSTPSQTSAPSSPSSLSADYEDNMIEGEFVSDIDLQETPDHVEHVYDPSKPQNLPQDVMDILMELDLDLFANERTEDTML